MYLAFTYGPSALQEPVLEENCKPVYKALIRIIREAYSHVPYSA